MGKATTTTTLRPRRLPTPPPQRKSSDRTNERLERGRGGGKRGRCPAKVPIHPKLGSSAVRGRFGVGRSFSRGPGRRWWWWPGRGWGWEGSRSRHHQPSYPSSRGRYGVARTHPSFPFSFFLAASIASVVSFFCTYIYKPRDFS